MTLIDILPPERSSNRGGIAHRAAGSVADASFVTIPRTMRRQAGPGDRLAGPRSQGRDCSVDGWTAFTGTALAAAEHWLMRLSADFFAAVVAVVFVAVFGLSGGFSLLLENVAPPAAARLALTHVKLTDQDADGMRFLLITGIVQNNGEQRLRVPSIQADLVTEGATVARTVIEPPVASIEGGHSHGFSTRLRHPGGKIPELRLSFASADASAH